MTDYQIVKFIENRAEKYKGGNDPRLVIYWRGGRAFIGIKFSNLDTPFIMRFTKGNQRGIFKLNTHDKEIREWCENIVASRGYYDSIVISYDLSMIPKNIKHFVSYAIIEALQTKGYGFDIFSPEYSTDDIELISANETYDEVSIEVDMLGI